jgi:DNA-binding transcriptional LysR family regulator
MHESDDYVVLQALVAHGLGVAVLPQLALSMFRHPGVRVTALPEFGERTVSVIHRPGAEEVPATRALMAQLRLSAAAVTRQSVNG